MKLLPLRPLPVVTEPLTDYLARLAHANGHSPSHLARLLHREGLSPTQALSAALGGYALPVFSGPADPRVAIPVQDFALKAADFTHYRHRFCPLCIDTASWLRPAWRLKVASVCAEHRVGLLEQCARCGEGAPIPSILAGQCPCGATYRHQLNAASSGQVQLMQTLTASLTGVAKLVVGERLEFITTAQLVRMISYTGRLLTGPALKRPGQNLDLEALAQASALFNGTAILLSDWPNAFWHCLSQYLQATPRDASIRRVFGALYRVIYQDLDEPVFQFWRDAFEQFLLEHWRGELCGRHRLFQPATVQKHPNKSLAHVVRGAGIGLKSLRRLVHQDRVPVSEFVYPSQRKLLTIDVTKLDSLIPDEMTCLELRSVARLFGLRPARIRQLVAAGVLQADAQPKEDGDYRWRFRRQVVEELLANIRLRSSTGPVDGDAVSLKRALRHWRLAPKEFCALIAAVGQGQIGFMLDAQAGLAELMFDRCELRGWLDQLRATSTDWITPVEAAKRLGLKEQVVYELVSKQLLAADLVPRQGRVFKRIALPSLEQFQAEYVALATLAKATGTSASMLLGQIEAQPVTGPRVDGGRQYFYRRVELPPAIADVFVV